MSLKPGQSVITGKVCSMAGILVLDIVVLPLRNFTMLSLTWKRNAIVSRTLIDILATFKPCILLTMISMSRSGWYFKLSELPDKVLFAL